jgi:hypothetical protein
MNVMLVQIKKITDLELAGVWALKVYIKLILDKAT